MGEILYIAFVRTVLRVIFKSNICVKLEFIDINSGARFWDVFREFLRVFKQFLQKDCYNRVGYS